VFLFVHIFIITDTSAFILQIFYLVTDSPQDLEKKQEEEIEVVPASYLAHNLVFLDKYTEYRIQVLAFNPAGDGPRSPPITVRTKQVIFYRHYIINIPMLPMLIFLMKIYIYKHLNSGFQRNCRIYQDHPIICNLTKLP